MATWSLDLQLFLLYITKATKTMFFPAADMMCREQNKLTLQ